jgi:hypothetical protein
MAECGNHAVGDNGLEVIWHTGERVEPDRPFDVSGIDVDEIIGAGSRNVGEHRFGEVAMRIEQRKPFAGREVLSNKLEKKGAFAGAGLANDVDVPAPFLGVEHDLSARGVGGNVELMA